MLRRIFDSFLTFTFTHSTSSMDLQSISADLINDPTQPAPSARASVLRHLLSLGRENSAYYHGLVAQSDGDAAEKYADVLAVLAALCGHIPEIGGQTDRLMSKAHLFDCPGVEGNGYRSVVACADAAVVKLVEANVYMRDHREKFYFRLASCTTDIRNLTDILGMFRAILQYAERMMGMEAETETRLVSHSMRLRLIAWLSGSFFRGLMNQPIDWLIDGLIQ